MKERILIVSALLLGWSPTVGFAEWTSFRNGGASVASGLPVDWSPESIAWQRELDGYGQSTPVIFKKSVFIASVVGPMKDKCLVQCMALESGKEQWRYELPAAKKSASNYMASRAAPTPVVDGNGIFVFFESGDIVALSLSGEKLWHRVLSEEFGEFENNHGLGSSPAQSDSHLFLNLEHRGPSFLVALRKSDGASEWKTERPSGSSWSSPIYVADGAQPQVIVSSAGSVTGYNPQDGKELWTVGGLDGNSVPSPTIHASKLFVGARLPEFAEEGSIRSNCCLDLSKGPAETPSILWRADKAISDYASPVVVGDYVYFINKVGVLHCLDSTTGDVHYRKRLKGACWATPVATDSHVYFFCKDGSTQVVEAADEFKLAATNHLWDPENPPKPESYVEFNGGGHGHGGPGAGASHGNASGPSHGAEAKSGGPPAQSERRPGGGMMAALMRGDSNGDGSLEGEEIPENFRPMLTRIDKNGDGKLDPKELKAMAKSFAERRAGAQAGARDPIVYGVAASDGCVVVRTGTRLYCVAN